jgi:hypothetical protein
MARYQYRLAGTFEWFASSGTALAAVTNKLGSGKKVNVRSVQISSLTAANNVTAGTPTSVIPQRVEIVRDGTLAGGTECVGSALDKNASALPSSFHVLKNANITGSPVPLGRILVAKNLVPAGLQHLFRQGPTTRFSGAVRAPRRGPGAATKVIIRQGENWSLRLPTQPELPLPLRVTLTVRRQGSPARTWMFEEFCIGKVTNETLLTVANDAGSGEIYEIVECAIEEVGTYDSPYFQLVPVGSMNDVSTSDPLSNPPVLKMDTNYPDSSTWVQVFQNAPLLPRDLPENALSDASTGSPKSSNYLKAKDFIGPVYRVLFPEYAGLSTLRNPDSLHHHLAPKKADMGVMRAGITLRPGEGIALVSAAETAAIATAVGLSGWNAYEVTVVFDVEPVFAPTLSVTGLTSPSEVRVYEAGTTTLLAGEESITDGTFSWTYDPDDASAVDISVLSLGYQNIRLLNQTLPSTADLTIPVQQQFDRQYENV